MVVSCYFPRHEKILHSRSVFIFWLRLFFCGGRKNGGRRTALFYLALVLLACLGKNFPVPGVLCTFQYLAGNTIFGRMFEFLVGASFSALYISKLDSSKKSSGLATYGGVGSFALSLLVLTFISYKTGNRFASTNIFGFITCAWMVPSAAGVTMYGLAREKTFIQRILSTKFILLLGKSSYTFYLIHMGVWQSFFQISGYGVIWYFLSTLVVSVGVFLIVEDPLNKFIRGETPFGNKSR
jgi:peptidoglycan/LPS O-acetylase OafA/YrhL